MCQYIVRISTFIPDQFWNSALHLLESMPFRTRSSPPEFPNVEVRASLGIAKAVWGLRGLTAGAGLFGTPLIYQNLSLLLLLGLSASHSSRHLPPSLDREHGRTAFIPACCSRGGWPLPPYEGKVPSLALRVLPGLQLGPMSLPVAELLPPPLRPRPSPPWCAPQKSQIILPRLPVLRLARDFAGLPWC